MKPTPLTEAQRAMWLEWIPYSGKVASNFLRQHPHLSDARDLIFAAARGAGEVAIRKWNPARGTYVTCLHWWTIAAIQKTAKQWLRDRQLLSLDAERGENSGNLYLLLNGWAQDPERETTARLFWQQAMRELPKRLIGKGMPAERAQEDVALYLRCLSETQTEVAAELGWSRQRLNNRLMRTHQTFERWAAELRKEAA